jgi:hypothetical protein
MFRLAALGHARTSQMAEISGLPMLHDIDADYSPWYVKLARIIRDKMESEQYKRELSSPPAISPMNTRRHLG